MEEFAGGVFPAGRAMPRLPIDDGKPFRPILRVKPAKEHGVQLAVDHLTVQIAYGYDDLTFRPDRHALRPSRRGKATLPFQHGRIRIAALAGLYGFIQLLQHAASGFSAFLWVHGVHETLRPGVESRAGRGRGGRHGWYRADNATPEPCLIPTAQPAGERLQSGYALPGSGHDALGFPSDRRIQGVTVQHAGHQILVRYQHAGLVV